MRHSLTAIIAACALALPTAFSLAQSGPPQQGQDPQSPGGGRGGQAGPGGQGQQSGGRGNRGMGRMSAFGQNRQQFEPDFMKRDVPLFNEQLGLEETQVVIIETIISDYEDEFTPAAEEARQAFQDSTRAMMQSFMGGMDQQAIGETFRTVQQQLEQIRQDSGAEVDPDTRRKLFEENFRALGEQMQTQRAANGGADETRRILADLSEVTREWSMKKALLRTMVIDGSKAVLSPTQMTKWDGFERFLRRERAMGNGVLSGESVNLIFVLDEAGLSQASIDLLKPALDVYELDLDMHLKNRDDFLLQSEAKLMKSVVDSDNTSAMNVVKRQIELRRAVRDCNDNYRSQMAARLSPEEAVLFATAVNKAAYERIFQRTGTHRAFEAALEFELEPSTYAMMNELFAAYQLDLGNLNERLVTATKKVEPEQRIKEAEQVLAMIDGTGDIVEMFSRGRRGGQGGSGDPSDPTSVIYDERREKDDTFRERLEALLTPEQVEQLPRRGRGGQGGQGGMGFGNGKIADLPERMQERAKEFDKNKDGTIDEAEAKQLMESMRSGGRGLGGQGRGQGQGQGQQAPDA